MKFRKGALDKIYHNHCLGNLIVSYVDYRENKTANPGMEIINLSEFEIRFQLF